jgi:hypothetical protein
MNRIAAAAAAMLFAASCSDAPPSGQPLPSDERALAPLFPPQASWTETEARITARVRLDLPKYRIRGTCELTRFADGQVQLDFVHSSLFGSVREEATIFIYGDSIAINDHVRGTLRGTEATLVHLREHFDFDIIPGDILVMMLLELPPLDEMEDIESSSSGGNWALEALWRGRRFAMEGREGSGPAMVRLCAADGKGCYEARYGYDSSGRLGGYPERIVCERKGGTERLSVSVESSEKIIH